MRFSAFFILSVLAAAVSCSPRVYPVQRDTVTQVRTEIVERLVRDTKPAEYSEYFAYAEECKAKARTE